MVIDYPSPNYADRELPVQHLVLHYTELDLQGSLAILTDGRRTGRVSSHYVLAEDGTVYGLVPETRVAWHAGRSFWRGCEQLNATSIGIEIVNLHGDRHDYPDRQIEALIALCQDVLGRHPAIEPRNVVGHSDIAPRRKIDPGLRFPWQRLADRGIGLWPTAMPDTRIDRPYSTDAMVEALACLGYARPHSYLDAAGGTVDVGGAELISAFQRRFRAARVDGLPDIETTAILQSLLAQVGNRP